MSLKFKNLYNLINVLTKFFNENPYLNVSYIFKKFHGLNQMKCDIPNGTTHSRTSSLITSMFQNC